MRPLIVGISGITWGLFGEKPPEDGRTGAVLKVALSPCRGMWNGAVWVLQRRFMVRVPRD